MDLITRTARNVSPCDSTPIRTALAYFGLGEPRAGNVVELHIWLVRSRRNAQAKFRGAAKSSHPDARLNGDAATYRQAVTYWRVLRELVATDETSVGLALKLVQKKRTYLLPCGAGHDAKIRD